MTQHIIPVNDLKPHNLESTCDCQPRLLMENNEMIFVHSAWDGREAVEEVNEILN